MINWRRAERTSESRSLSVIVRGRSDASDWAMYSDDIIQFWLRMAECLAAEGRGPGVESFDCIILGLSLDTGLVYARTGSDGVANVDGVVMVCIWCEMVERLWHELPDPDSDAAAFETQVQRLLQRVESTVLQAASHGDVRRAINSLVDTVGSLDLFMQNDEDGPIARVGPL